MNPLRTARSILASFHDTTWPERRIRRGETTVGRNGSRTTVRQSTSAFATSSSRRSISAASTSTERS